jgi:hypothetical protein
MKAGIMYFTTYIAALIIIKSPPSSVVTGLCLGFIFVPMSAIVFRI